MKKFDLFDIVKDTARQRQSLYSGRAKDRESLIAFLEMNSWFGFEDDVKLMNSNTFTDKQILIHDEFKKVLSENIVLWLDGFKRSNEAKFNLLINFGKKRLPQTVSIYEEFITENSLGNQNATWQLLDFLLDHLNQEITVMEIHEIDNLIELLSEEATRIVCELFIKFEAWRHKKFSTNVRLEYRLGYRRKRSDIEAYTLNEFSRMAYCIFNHEYWEQEQLVEKACESAKYANLWAFIAMHFVCALRSTDIIRIPKPDLRECGEEFRRKILSGELKNAELISRDIQIRFNYKSMKPNKVINSSNATTLKLFIATTLEKPLGIILGIAASHCEHIKIGEPFLHQDREVTRVKKFLGKYFVDILGGKCFASRRANKSYLQGCEIIADENSGNAKGYMIAALARSHAGGIGTLPKTTDIYLKDAKFSGYKPEFIAREMFERGVFGFIPHLLLEIYAGHEYKELSISDQTQIIKAICIHPYGIECIIELCNNSLFKARKTVEEILTRGVNISDIIQKIATGEAVGKQQGCLCIMTAGGFSCAYPQRATCIGCSYEIHTKTILHQLSSEYSRMKGLVNTEDGWRYRTIIQKVILPLIGEYIATLKQSIPDSDMNIISDIMEGGLLNYAYNSKSNR